ncbi:MAG: hypothetical protein LBB75_06530 [Oscillospiraceae bacterium]|jgi:hypothetical protein|nr:hypothetical protein [Oscillospiraceae bacterium]
MKVNTRGPSVADLGGVHKGLPQPALPWSKAHPHWPKKPKSLTEGGYRKYMAKRKGVTVRGLNCKLQSVSPSWYLDLMTDCKDNGNLDNRRYMDELLRACVVLPAEIRNKGLGFFDERDDRRTAMDLVKEINRFLDEPAEYGGGESGGDKE